MSAYRLLADLIVLLHLAYVSFVVFGLVAIVIGVTLKKSWARNGWFRIIHLTMILIVVFEAWMNIPCPLTTWENRLRVASGQDAFSQGFIERLIHSIMFFRLPAWVFVVGYTTFGLTVLATFLLAPPRRPNRLSFPMASGRSKPS